MHTSRWTRRQFVLGATTAGAAAAARGSVALAWADTSAPRWVFLGTGSGEGIYRAGWNAGSGEIGPVELATAAERPDFFVRHPHLPVLYSVNESSGPVGAVSSFRIDRDAGGLRPINKVDSHGAGPCALGIDRTGRALFVADYAGGAFAAYHLESTGAIGSLGGTLACQSNPICGSVGPVKDRQDEAHLHCAVVAPGNDFVLVCDLGDDAIEILPFAPGPAHIIGKPQRVEARRGSGPRHLVFHPSGKWFYCIHELDCTIDLYDWKSARGVASATLREGSSISTLASGAPRNGNTGCELQITRDGQFLYACTRGVDEISVYAVDRETGTLTEVQRVRSGGSIPRYFALDPTERRLVCTNQGAAGTGQGACVTVFARDAGSGQLGTTPRTFTAPTPMFVLWV